MKLTIGKFILPLLIISLFLGGQRKEIGIDVVRTFRFSLYGFVAYVGLIYYSVNSGRINTVRLRKFLSICWPFLIFLLISFFSILQSEKFWLLIFAKSSEILLVCLSFMMMSIFDEDPNDLWRMYVHFFTLMIIIALAQSVFVDGSAMFSDEYRLEAKYPYMGTGPLTLGAVMIIGYYVLLADAGRNRTIAMVVLGLVVIVLCKSRGGLFSFLLAMAVASRFSSKMRWISYRILAVGSIIISFIGGYKIYEHIILRGGDINSLLNMSGRIYHWKAAVSLIKKNLYFGQGYYAAVRIYMPMQFREKKIFSTVDNVWLDLLLGVGLVGTVFFTFFVIKVFLSIFRDCRYKYAGSNSVVDYNHIIFILFLFVFSMVWTFSGNYIHYHGFPNITLFLIVLSAAYYSSSASQEAKNSTNVDPLQFQN